LQVWKAYQSLSAEQKRVLREKRIEMNRPIGPLLEFLKPLGSCDSMADKARTKLGCAFAVSIGLTIVTIVIGFHDRWAALPILLFVVALVPTIAFGRAWSWTRGIDVSNNFRQFALPVLTVLREDFDPSQPLHVKLDLTAPTAAPKKRGESAPFPQGGYYKVIETTYVDEWMSVDGLLVDGTKLSWQVTDSIRERRKTKRTSRGKHKTKTKYKKKSEIEVSMALRKKTYALVATEGELSSDEKRNTVRVSREVITASLDPIDPRALLDLVADVFRSARPAKEAGA
jgi:hypothetical protein